MSVQIEEKIASHGTRTLIRSRHIAYALITFVLLLGCVIRFHLRNIPLERDEGEYAYAGQLMLQGIPPYKLAYNMKLPGTYAAYALIEEVFGQTPAGVHLGILVVNATTIFLVFLLGLRLAGAAAGVVAGASYALLSVNTSMLGFSGHATHFVVLMAMAGILLLLEALNKNNLWLLLASGTFCGLAFLMKQPGLLFAVFGALFLLWTERLRAIEWRALTARLGLFLIGVVFPFVVTCLWLWRAGVFRTFWFWTISYASQYATNWSLGDGIHLFAKAFPGIVGPGIGIWIIAAVGITALIWDRELRPQAPFVLGFLLFSFLAVCPGLIFREHYFILLLPAISLLAGIAVSASMKIVSRHSHHKTLSYVPAMLFFLALAWCIYSQKNFLFEDEPITTCRKVFGGNPFPEAIPIADYIRQHTSENDSIAVLGSEPEIYFYAHRHSATGYIYTYSLMEEQKYALQMQQQMIREIEAVRPESLVWVNVNASWLPHEHSEGLILSWAREYVHDHYTMTGVADIHMSQTDYHWGDDAKSYQPRSNSVVFVFKRTTP